VRTVSLGATGKKTCWRQDAIAVLFSEARTNKKPDGTLWTEPVSAIS